MSAPVWLKQVCAGVSRPEIAEPHSIVINGVTHTVATDGHRLLALPIDYGFSPFSDGLATTIASMLAKKPDGVLFDVSRFRALVDSIVPPRTEPCDECDECGGVGKVTCPECDGEGGDECECLSCGHVHEQECRRCADSGFVQCGCVCTPPSVPVIRIGAGMFNADLLTKPTELLVGPVAVWIDPDPRKMAHFYGEGWRLALMPVRPSEDALATFDLCAGGGTVSAPRVPEARLYLEGA